jgi:hypothetical protein
MTTPSERDRALCDVIALLREYRKGKPLPRAHENAGTPAQRVHWAYMRGTEAGERAALYSAICRIEALLSDRSLIETDL